MAERWAVFLDTLAQGIDGGLGLPASLRLAGATAGGALVAFGESTAVATSQGQALGAVLESSVSAADPQQRCPPIVAAIIAAGEHSGRLPELCRMLAAQRRMVHDALRRTLPALLYPVLLMHAALTMPMIVAAVAGVVKPWLIPVPVLLLWAACAGGVMVWRRKRERWLLAWPCSIVTWPMLTARASVAQAAACAAGLLSDRAMELVGQASGHALIEARLCAAAQRLRRDGRTSIAEAWRSAGFPDWAVSALHAGEISGALEAAAARTANEALLHWTSRLEWAARLASGLIYSIAAIVAIIAILWIFWRFYVQPILSMGALS